MMTSPRKLMSSMKTSGDGSIIYSIFDQNTHNLNPVIRFDEFEFTGTSSYKPGFFEGYEELIYMIDGELHHSDDLGNSKTISKGDAQRIIGGKGLHLTEKKAGSKKASGICIWLNTGKDQRKKLPDFSLARSNDFPVTQSGSVEMITICGEDSPLQGCEELILKDIHVASGSFFRIPLNSDHLSVFYLVNGDAEIGETALSKGEAVILNSIPELTISSGKNSARIIYLSACPVKNTDDDLPSLS